MGPRRRLAGSVLRGRFEFGPDFGQGGPVNASRSLKSMEGQQAPGFLRPTLPPSGPTEFFGALKCVNFEALFRALRRGTAAAPMLRDAARGTQRRSIAEKKMPSCAASGGLRCGSGEGSSLGRGRQKNNYERHRPHTRPIGEGVASALIRPRPDKQKKKKKTITPNAGAPPIKSAGGTAGSPKERIYLTRP